MSFHYYDVLSYDFSNFVQIVNIKVNKVRDSNFCMVQFL